MGYQRDLETSVPMRLYFLKKKHLTLLTFVVIGINFISVLIGALGPSVLIRRNELGSQILSGAGTLSTGFFKVPSYPVLLYQKEIWLSAIIFSKKDNVVLSIPLKTSVSVICRAPPEESANRKDLQDHSSEPGEVVSIQKFYNDVTLVCSGGTGNKACNEFPVIHLSTLNCSSYTFKVSFQGLPTAAPQKTSEFDEDSTPISFEVDEVEFITQTYNSAFSYFELILRFIAFLLAFSLIIVFSLAMRSFGYQLWTIEQRGTLLLLTLHLFFYNPFHPLVFLLPSWIAQSLDGFFQASFFAGFLLFWLCAFDGLRVTQRTFCRFYCPRLLLTSLIWLLVLSFNGWFVHSEHTNPLFSLLSYPTIVKVYLALLGALTFIYLLTFLVLLLRSHAELRAMPYYDVRLRFLLVPVFFMVIGLAVVAGLRFDPHGPLFYRPVTTDLAASVDVPVVTSRVAFPLFRSAFELSFVSGLAFACMLTMVVAYGPAKKALSETNFKNNASVSMTYDSDEDVLYGSDRDDLRLRGSIQRH